MEWWDEGEETESALRLHFHLHKILNRPLLRSTSFDFRSTAHTFNINNKKKSVLWRYSYIYIVERLQLSTNR